MLAEPSSPARRAIADRPRPPLAIIYVGALVAVAALAVIDYVTGNEISFSIFYLAPIALVTWYGGRVPGIIAAVIAAATWGAVDLAVGARYSSQLIPVWNSAVRLGFFLSTLLLLAEMKRAHENALRLARTDALTGLDNTRAFYGVLGREMTRLRRYERPFALAYVDLDDFKSVNDTLGHAAGDSLLADVAAALVSAVRESDTVARLGGDEFAILLPETDAVSATAILDRARDAVLRAMETVRRSAPHAGATIGAVVCLAAPASADDALTMADHAMYDRKRGERGTVSVRVYDAGRDDSPRAHAGSGDPGEGG